MLAKVRVAIERAIEDGMFPGAALLVHYNGQVVHHEVHGNACLEPQRKPLTRDTLFDLASLTKPIATATAVLQLIAKGRLSLYEPVSRFIPDFLSPEKKRITMFHLLTHSSGLPAWKPFYAEVGRLTQEQSGIRNVVGAKPLMYELIHQEPLAYPAGSESVYSDLGFILLGEIVEKVAQQTLDEYCQERIFGPLGMRDTGFLPLYSERQMELLRTRSFAATEKCPWRGRVLIGSVHDENAYIMGGVAGHAGLFGTAQDLYLFLRAYLESLNRDGGFFPSKLVREFVTRQTQVPQSPWALGWTTPSPPSASGQYFSSNAFGHLGFTGTSIWVDPDVDLIVIFLTNRVHPSRENQKIRLFRPLLHDLIYESTVMRSSHNPSDAVTG